MHRRNYFMRAAFIGCCLGFFAHPWPVAGAPQKSSITPVYGAALRDDAASAAAFESMVKVLHNARCMNCHSKGDFPRQGDDEHPHIMNVRRGAEGDGVAGVKCNTCHQDHNLVGEHTPPGAPGWHLPSPEMPMIWEGLTDAQLCELFKDPARNGHRTVAAIVEHMHTPLVLWGWNPGKGRTPISVSQNEFLAEVNEWASKGAACPGEKVLSQK
jgi:cytochrome c5